MSAVDDFKGKFDSEGRLNDQNGSLAVVFATKGGSRFPGKLYFSNGLCVRAEMESGGDWANPDQSPIDKIRFLLDFGGETLHAIAIDQGRLINLDEPRKPSSKREFLLNFRVARNLFVHSPKVEPDSPTVDAADVSRMLVRAAIWLTPKSVAGFNANDFPELGNARQAELAAAVRDFKAVAEQVPSDKPASDEQYATARQAFAKILQVLEPYLPLPDEAKQVESALHDAGFPPWVVNWDYELTTDSDGDAVVWVDVFIDEHAFPKAQLGRKASELTSNVRQVFDEKQIHRWPYIRMRTAMEHKVG